jgi:hypothetical protein
MKAELTIWERLWLSGEAGGLKGTAALIEKALRLREAVELSDEERDQANLRRTRQGLQWDDETAEEREIRIADREAAGLVKRLVREAIEKQERGEAWTVDLLRKLSALAEKVGVDFDAVVQEVAEEQEEGAETAS